MLLLVVAGYLALAPRPVMAAGPDPAAGGVTAAAGGVTAVSGGVTAVAGPVAAGWLARVRPAALRQAIAGASARSVVCAGAVAVIMLGVAPMAAAAG